MGQKIRALSRDTSVDGAKNNQYEMLNGDTPIAKYMKTVCYAVAGVRINPNSEPDAPELQDFMLRTSDNDFAKGDWGIHYQEPSYWRFNYANDVVELYSPEELRIFKAKNKVLLDKGILKEYDNTENGTSFEAIPPEPNEVEQRVSKPLQWGRV